MNICTRDTMDYLHDNALVREELIEKFEDRFVALQGEPKAWFEIPQRGGDPVRGVYVVYVVRGRDLDEVKNYFMRAVIESLVVKAQTEEIGNSNGPFLYWRIKDKVEVTYERQSGEFRIYTRICVLDNDLNSVVIDKMIKQEGQPTPTCAYSAGAY